MVPGNTVEGCHETSGPCDYTCDIELVFGCGMFRNLLPLSKLSQPPHPVLQPTV